MKKMKIKDWYEDTFPDDELGSEINPNATFGELMNNLPNVYDYIGVGDSVVRERIFVELSNIMGVNYKVVYEGWLRNKSKEPTGKCLTIDIGSNVVIMEDLSMYEIINNPKYNYPIVVKLPSKANVDFADMYGDGVDTSKANWTNPYLPVVWNGVNLEWDY